MSKAISKNFLTMVLSVSLDCEGRDAKVIELSDGNEGCSPPSYDTGYSPIASYTEALRNRGQIHEKLPIRL